MVGNFIGPQSDRAHVYEVGWQKLRVSTLAPNRKDGGWGTHIGVQRNLITMAKYLDGTNDPEEVRRRQYRVLNMYNAVLLGYGDKFEMADFAMVVRQARDRLQKQMSDRSLGRHDWQKTYEDLSRLWRNERNTWWSIRRNLTSRTKTSRRRNGGTGFQHRPELEFFLHLMEASSQ
jgi:hypothetical protein